MTFSFDGSGEEPEEPEEPAEDEQVITVVVPEVTDPGEFLWTIDGDRTVDLGTTVNQGTFLQATGSITPIVVTDTRTGGPEWSVSGQVADFTAGLPGRYLGWSPQVLAPGAGATAGAEVPSGIVSGDGLTVPSVLASAPSGHASGTASIGANLDLRLPVDTAAGEYSTVLTITALG